MFLTAVSWRAELCHLGELGNKKNSSLSGTVVNRAYQISIQTIHQPLDGFLSVVVSTLLLLHSWCFLYPRYPCSPPGTPSPPQPPGWSFSRSQPCSPTTTTIKCYCSDIRRWGKRQFHVFNRSFMTFCVIYRVQKKFTSEKLLVRRIIQIRDSTRSQFSQNTLPRSIGKWWLSSDHSTIY